MPEKFELSLLATGKRFSRTVDGQGRISIKRYRLDVRVELKRKRVEIREFFNSLVVIYQSGAVISSECTHSPCQMAVVKDTPVCHEHPSIDPSPQLELFDLSPWKGRYVTKRPPYRKRILGLLANS